MGARIRADLVGQLMAYRRTEDGRPIRATPLYLSAGDEVPDGVLVSERHLESADSDTGPGAGTGEGGQGESLAARPAPFDPDEFSVDDVNEKMADLDEADQRAVIEAELGGRGRKGIVDGPVARALPQED